MLGVPPDHDSSDVTARRILNWIYAWQRLPEADVAGLAESIGEQARHVRANLTAERNHRTLELYALLIVALALPELSIEPPVAELHDNLLTDFGPDGVHRERSTHYHFIALRSFVGARENCRRFGVALPAGFDERLTLACEFARDCRRPDGTIPAISDSDTGNYDELLTLAGRLLSRDDLLDGRPNTYADGGYAIQRQGDRFLILDCGPLGDGGHGHYDALSVEAWAGEHALVMDPGRYTYAEGEPNLRHWFRGTAAHNTVTVDGTDQTPYARGRSSLPSAEARLLSAGDTELVAEVRSPVYEAIHRRRVVFTGRYWVIEDVLTGERPHRYDLRWHLAPGRVQMWASGVTSPTVAITILGARSIALEDGWISPAYGIREAAPVVSAVATGAERPLHHAAHPARARRPGPDPERRRRHRVRRRRASPAAMTELAPDPAVPRRNALLRPLTMAEVLSQRLHGGVPGRALRADVRQVPRRRQPARRLPLPGRRRHPPRVRAHQAHRPGARRARARGRRGAVPVPVRPQAARAAGAGARLAHAREPARDAGHAAAGVLRRRAVGRGGLRRCRRSCARVRQGPARRRRAARDRGAGEPGRRARAARTGPRAATCCCSRRSKAAASTTWTRSTARWKRSGAPSAACTRWPWTSPASNASTCRGWRRPRP